MVSRFSLIPRFRRFSRFLALGFMVLLLVTGPAFANGNPQQNLQRLDGYVQQAIDRTNARDMPGAAQVFQQFSDQWLDIEDGVKAASRPTYREIEDAMGEVKFTLSSQPPNPTQVHQALQKLHSINQKFIQGTASAQEPTPAPASGGKVTIASLLERLNRIELAINQQDGATAIPEIKGFQADWTEVEGIVAAKSRPAYGAIENNMAKMAATARNQDFQETKAAIAALKQDLQPFAEATLRYSLFDSAVILLREGLEALLVLVALLAFLSRSGNGDKSHWLWIGTGAGLVASIITALVIQLIFAQVPVGSNRELLEGCTGLVAAGMLFYVSYWLHSKSALGAWQGYIQQKATAALATNSVFSLSLLAFLAVYREGAETVLFYIGIAPSISTTDLLGGLALGFVLLVAIAALMLGLGLKIPLKPFFMVTSLLIYYLGFKFVGTGIHALQVAGFLPANTASFLPASESLGLYPTWETTLPQLALLLGAIAIVLHTRLQSRQPIAPVE